MLDPHQEADETSNPADKFKDPRGLESMNTAPLDKDQLEEGAPDDASMYHDVAVHHHGRRKWFAHDALQTLFVKEDMSIPMGRTSDDRNQTLGRREEMWKRRASKMSCLPP
jgi:hypothetical protein